MKISAIQPNVSYHANNAGEKQVPQCKSTANLEYSKDSVSFGANKSGYLRKTLDEINHSMFPEGLYLNLEEVYKSFEKQRAHSRFESFCDILHDLTTKRSNYLGITKNAEPAGTTFAGKDIYIGVFEPKNNKRAISVDYDITKEYKELKDFFYGTDSIPLGAADDMRTIKEFLPAILKRQGWIK